MGMMMTELKELFDSVTPTFLQTNYDIELRFSNRDDRKIVVIAYVHKKGYTNGMKSVFCVRNWEDMMHLHTYLTGLHLVAVSNGNKLVRFWSVIVTIEL